MEDDDDQPIEYIEEEAQMLTLEQITDMNGGYQGGEYSGFLRRLMTRGSVSFDEDAMF